MLKGVIYDVIVEPPSVGSTTDAMGRSKPVNILKIILMKWKKINNQNKLRLHLCNGELTVNILWKVWHRASCLQWVDLALLY